MKKIILCSLATLFAFTFVPNAGKAATVPCKTEYPNNSDASKTILIAKSNEITAIKKSTTSKLEKNALGNEVQTIAQKQHIGPGGIYISVGALIIIILLLIIFL